MLEGNQNPEPKAKRCSLPSTAVDENNNIYSVIGNNRGGVVVDGFSIEMGNSLIKLNSNGNIQWVRKISDERYLPRQVHVWNNDVFVVGQLDEAINQRNMDALE